MEMLPAFETETGATIVFGSGFIVYFCHDFDCVLETSFDILSMSEKTLSPSFVENVSTSDHDTMEYTIICRDLKEVLPKYKEFMKNGSTDK